MKRTNKKLSKYSFNDMEEECYVYVLECSDGTLYTGYTNKLQNRMNQHREGNGAKYTQSHGFKQLLYFERHINKSQAMKREYEIKKKGTKYKWLLVRNFDKNLELLNTIEKK